MRCCPGIETPFVNEAVSTVDYTPLMRQQFGQTPRVYVWYRNLDTGTYLQSSFFTLISFENNQVVVDHGGEQTGFIVIR